MRAGPSSLDKICRLKLLGYFFSSRLTFKPYRYRKITEQWLTWNVISFGDMYMRGDNDFRSDHVIKEEILGHLLSRGKRILFVVDDRQQVVDMWRRNGITVLQCDEGDF